MQKTTVPEPSERVRAVRDGMLVEWDVPIVMDDGIALRADIFRPPNEGTFPAILSYGPYAKGLSFQEYFPKQWQQMCKAFPEVLEGSSCKYQNWEVVDPEKWVPDGYACVRIDSRGAGRSPGYIDQHSPREAQDFHDCIEWVAKQNWCNGKVGLNGISYYAVNQWRVASLQPPHLAALCVWEGCADRYRESTHHGGILSTFARDFQPKQILRVQHGLGTRGPRSSVTGEYVSGPRELDDSQLEKNRAPQWQQLQENELDNEFYQTRSAVWNKIEVPLLSAGNWGGHGLHLRGNIEGFLRAASREKWLEVHGHAHWTHFYSDYGLSLQKKFFGHFLKGEDTGWAKQPKVQLQIRHPGERFVQRDEASWPIDRTQWMKLYLTENQKLSPKPSSQDGVIEFDALGDGLQFKTEPLAEEVEITGPLMSRMLVSSTTSDADLFLVLSLFDPEGREVLFHGANDPAMPIAMGWLRASHRKLDCSVSLPYRPYHSHDEKLPLSPGIPVPLDIEIWPTCIVCPKGYTLALSVRGKDFEHSGPAVPSPWGGEPMRGAGPFQHNDEADRPRDVFGGRTTIHISKGEEPYLQLPVIPPKSEPNRNCLAFE
ncbi:MAG: CocE/NonD family hydrolase [Rhizobiaceae bacterium]|nr:CocE/NonD family hydrolase [Rhizobiaceae bacterium]